MKRLISGLLISAIFVLSLAGCGGGGDDVVYQAGFLGLDSQYRELSALAVSGDSIFLLAQELAQNGESPSVVVELDAEGRKRDSFQYVSQQFELEEGRQGQSAVEAIAADSNGNIWLIEHQYSIKNPGENVDLIVEPRIEYALTKIDGKGNVLLSMNLDEFLESKNAVEVRKQIMCDKENNAYLLLEEECYGQLRVYSEKGELLYEPDTGITAMAATENGEVLVSVEPSEPDAGPVLCLLDVKNKSFGAKIETEFNYSYFYGGRGSTVYFNDLTAIYSYDLTTQETVKIFDWMDSDLINSSIQYFNVLPDGSFMLLGTGIYNMEQDVLILRPVPASTLAEKTTLTVATGRAAYQLKAAAVQFNKTNMDYKIKIVEYVDTNRPDISSLDRLYIDIVSGNIPDMIDLDFFSTEQLVHAGVMEDLYPYLDADPHLSKEDFLPNLIEAIDTEGCLYYLPQSFCLQLVAGDADVVGDSGGWNLQKMYDLVENNMDYEYIMGLFCGQKEFFNLAVDFNLTSYIDYKNYDCNFDKPEFYELLEFTRENFSPDGDEVLFRLPTKQYAPVMEGEQLLYSETVVDAWSIMLINELFGGNASFIGFPSEGDGGNAFIPLLSLGISKASTHKEIAWEFLRQFYLDESNDIDMNVAFPSNINALRAVLNKLTEKVFLTNDSGEKIEDTKYSLSFPDNYGQRIEVELYALTQVELDYIWEIILRVNKISAGENKIEAIVEEEASAFFAGDRTAEETAALINSRVKLLLSERK